ncbi:unnamed protein product, partial [Hapterophycus canaliculatus]
LFQNGEDVRQDQLAVHMVSLMDRQLKEAGLDLRLKVRALCPLVSPTYAVGHLASRCRGSV